MGAVRSSVGKERRLPKALRQAGVWLGAVCGTTGGRCSFASGRGRAEDAVVGSWPASRSPCESCEMPLYSPRCRRALRPELGKREGGEKEKEASEAADSPGSAESEGCGESWALRAPSVAPCLLRAAVISPHTSPPVSLFPPVSLCPAPWPCSSSFVSS